MTETNFNGHINAALLLLDEALTSISEIVANADYLPEETNECADAAHEDIKSAKAELLTDIKRNNTRHDDWQPIETAPKDGTIIEIFNNLEGWPRPDMLVMGYWWDGVIPENYHPDDYFTRINKGPGWWACSFGYISHPTHWRPMPEPPAQERHD